MPQEKAKELKMKPKVFLGKTNILIKLKLANTVKWKTFPSKKPEPNSKADAQ